ncbi:MAG TPA: PIG-L family deacetylase [Puia sp.]|nr:PIG-L family deacetylase [Puia sp.]
MKIFYITCLFLMTGAQLSCAQRPESPDASDILVRMKKLRVLGSVLYIAAHPDDENTRLLAWLSREKLYRTGYLSLTRGDGGQNLLGDEQGVELGLIRTQELLAARRIDGAEQFFSRAFDFGFSKSTAEALRIWDEQKILGDVVWVIRRFQPDVIITRFPEDSRAGHGQHSASSVLAHLAFAAAADPKQFPEQFRYGVKPWQAKRIFWNNYNFGNVNTIRSDQLQIEVGGFNPLLGKSYGEIAAESRSQHRSQGFGVARSYGSATEYFSLTEGAKAESSLMDGVDVGWSRVNGGAEIATQIDEMIHGFDPSNPAGSLGQLIALYGRINALEDGYWKKKKLAEVQGLIEACSGILMEASVHQPYGVATESVAVNLHIVNRTQTEASLEGVVVNRTDSNLNLRLAPDQNRQILVNVSLNGLPVTQPYWLVQPMSPGCYNVDDQSKIGEAENKPALMANFRLKIMGQVFEFQKPVLYEFTEPARGESFEPFIIVPETTGSCHPEILLFTGRSQKELDLDLHRNGEPPKSLIHQTVASGSPEASGQPAAEKESSVSLTPAPFFKITPPAAGALQSFQIAALDGSRQPAWTWAVQSSGDTLLQRRTIAYEHIPRIDYFRPVRARLLSVDLKIKGNRIGYIEGAGDKVPNALQEMGYTVVILNEGNLSAAMLRSLDAVITGVRAYDVHAWLFSKYSLLMDYIHDGGNLIVQYNRNNSENARTRIGPYPFSISNARVTEEDAPVEFVQPNNSLLQFPNRITGKDFEGWIQERGIYFASNADPAYQQVLAMHDTGESDAGGSLITASYGKGHFTYTGLVFFRELPAGVPGAYRLMANLIALNQNSK